MAGGAGIYISSSLNALPRSDLNFERLLYDGYITAYKNQVIHV